MSQTKNTPLISIQRSYHETNAQIMKVIEELSDRHIRWQPNPACHSIAFILWHLARWNDHLQATIPGMTIELARRLPPGQQIWEKEHFATRWGFEASRLGYAETGTDADIEATGEPDWPKKEILLHYARQAFSAAEQAISAIDEGQFVEIEQQQYADKYIEETRANSVTVGNAVMEHLVHNIQHLGEIDYLRGLINEAERC